MEIKVRPADTRFGPTLMGRILPGPINNRIGYGYFNERRDFTPFSHSLSLTDSTSSSDLCHHRHHTISLPASNSITVSLNLYHRQSQDHHRFVSLFLCLLWALICLLQVELGQDLPQPRSLIFFFLLFCFGFITWCLKGVLLCIFICGIYFVDFWTWCNGPGFGFGGFILYIFELVANLVVKEDFFFNVFGLCI